MSLDGIERRLAAIVSADVAGYSRLMAEDEDGTARRLAAYRAEIALLVQQHGGRIVDFTGDNFLAEHRSALAATRCALEIQRVLAARNADLAPDRRMELRIGVHLGDVRVDGERILGDGVNVAARLEAMADPGGLCVSGSVHEQVRNKLGVDFEDLGDQPLKNIPDPVRVFRLRAAAPPAALAPGRPSKRRVVASAVVAALLLAAGALALLWIRAGDRADEAAVALDVPIAVANAEPEPSIAVLAFDDMSPNRDQAYFADGVAEAILNGLTRVDGLRVMARTSAFSFRGQNLTVQEIGERLAVAAVLEGSVQRSGDRVRITAQLIQTSDGFHLWSQSYDRELAAIFELQDEIARAVVAEVGPKLRGTDAGQLIEPPTENQEAYDLYLLSLFGFDEQTEAAFEKGIELVRRAIALDPRFAQAHWLEGVHRHFLVTLGFREIGSWAEAVAALRRALDIDPDLAAAHGLLGEIEAFRWNWEAAEVHGRRAIDLAPGSMDAHMTYAWGLSFTGRTEKAVEHLERARALDPLSWLINRNLGIHLLWDRQYDRAIRQLRHSLVLSGDVPLTRLALAEACWLQGDHGAWAAELQQAYRLLGSEREAERIDELFATSGLQGVLQWWVAHLSAEENAAQLSRIGDPNGWGSLARSHLKLGDLDAAFAVLEQMVDRHLTFSNALKVNPSFDALRDDPRYDALLRRMNLAG